MSIEEDRCTAHELFSRMLDEFPKETQLLLSLGASCPRFHSLLVSTLTVICLYLKKQKKLGIKP